MSTYKDSYWNRAFLLKETGIDHESAKELGFWSDEDEKTFNKVKVLEEKFNDGLITKEEFYTEVFQIN